MPALNVPDGGGLVPLERRVLTLWRIRAAAALGGSLLALLTASAATSAWLAGGAVVLVVAGVGGAAIVWWTALVWRSWQFRIGEHALHLRHGVLTRHESTIPFHRVQHIDLEAGPLERRFGLTSLVLRTASASSDASVPGLDAEEAQLLRARILELVGTGDAL